MPVNIIWIGLTRCFDVADRLPPKDEMIQPLCDGDDIKMSLCDIELAVFPGFDTVPGDVEKRSKTYRIFLYLRQLLQSHGIAQGHEVQLPSISRLAAFFRASQMDVYDAFQQLRKSGIDYHLQGMDAPITFEEISPKAVTAPHRYPGLN